MNKTTNRTLRSHIGSAAVAAGIETACNRIAPTWPLDQFIAVNPYWGWRSSHIEESAGMLGALAGTVLTMPRDWYREKWAALEFNDRHLDSAAAALGDPKLAAAARVALQRDQSDPAITRMALVTDVRDLTDAPRPGQSWKDHVTHEISQHCGAHFDEWQATWQSNHNADLFTRWRLQHAAVHGLAWHRGRPWVREQIASLPSEPIEAIEFMLDELTIAESGCDAYLTALLQSINGWASWCAYRRWQARLNGQDDAEIVALLAVRLTWDWLLRNDHDAVSGTSSWIDWADSWSNAVGLGASITAQQRIDWVLQTAVEHAYQDQLISGLQNQDHAPAERPTVQAVFCIDVRSEVFRRALESITPVVHTRGFAGFFGLPIAYTPVGSSLTRPQLPGLLAPTLNVTETVPEGSDRNTVVEQRTTVLERAQRWNTFGSAPSSVFSLVESTGLLYLPKLVKDSLAHTSPREPWEHDGIDARTSAGLRPRLSLVDDDPAAAAAIAHRVLRAMSLVGGFAPLVLLCGHGSQTVNNPHAAGLDCGACGGQAGDVNARVLADLLNSTAVRAHLAPLGIEIPSDTLFVPALHNTTTDEVQLFDVAFAPPDLQASITTLQQWLNDAGDRARAERAGNVGYGPLPAKQLKRALTQRANDWSQVRPEWGLAGNAAFVVAPRSRTRGLSLDGRVFLHDYDWRIDTDFSTINLIMTAPMLVTNWINLQYHASTVDNRRYGAGNKVLHNVVGGRIGVFEGNGGDLRIGLAMQSLHDGTALRHQPLRLSVFIEAPREGIDQVIHNNEVVSDLVANRWLHLLRIEPETGVIERRTPDDWRLWEPA